MRYKELDVYKRSIEYLAIAWQLVSEIPRGHSEITDQLKRASISIPLNIGEGAGRRSATDSGRYYAISRGSAMECSAVLDVLCILNLCDKSKLDKGQELLYRIVSMLTKMCR